MLRENNNLEKSNPELVKEWNYEKNGDLKPTQVSAGSHKKVWWKCSEGHEWLASIYNRVKGSGCPYCSNVKLLTGYNDLATTNPKLAKEWNYEKNGDLKPTQVTVGSNKKVWWKCSKGHEWQATIASRSSGSGCPYCSNVKLLTGYNDLATTNSELAKEWNYEKNGDLKPTRVMKGCGKKVWWTCTKGHEWQATINNRAKGTGCPYCSNQKVLIGYNDLATSNPQLAKEWNYEKNEDLKPTQVTVGSNKKVWWKCTKGHEWQATINHRINGTGCPICANKKISVGYNDLATTNPMLAKEWNYEKNGDLKPTQVVEASNKKVWWKCKKGHTWKATIAHRTNGTGCPVCSKDIQTSFPEQAIFYYLSKYFENVENRYIIDKNECDIYLKDYKLAIEYDGQTWHKDINKDIKKITNLNNFGIKTINIREPKCPKIYLVGAVFYNLKDLTINELENAICFVVSYINNHIKPQIDIKKDRIKILENTLTQEKEKSLVYSNPALAEEWNYEKNGELKPEYFTQKSAQIVWWKCSKGHEWQASISNRTKGSGCPYCTNYKALEGYNDLVTTNPELAKEWNYEKNGDMKPTQFTIGSDKKVWWKCANGHEWQTRIANRSKEKGCPYCSSQKVLAGYNDLATANPELAKEWNCEKNGDLKPTQVTISSGQKVWWTCSKGHEWQATIASRSNGCGCPYCSDVKLLTGYNDLATTNPELAKEWNYEKNGDLKPTQVMKGCGKKVWWTCSKGHDYQATINHRSNGSGCPYCSNYKVLTGYNDLATINPELAKEWNYEKNGDLKPTQVTASSGKKVWWKCSNGHEWQTTIAHRSKGSGCPHCYRKRILK